MWVGYGVMCICSERVFSFSSETGRNKPLEGSGGKGVEPESLGSDPCSTC